MELDMILNDLPPPGPCPAPPKIPTHSTTAYRVPVERVPVTGGEGDIRNRLQEEEKVLEGQLSNLSNKRNQLTGELEGLISQVCHMTGHMITM